MLKAGAVDERVAVFDDVVAGSALDVVVASHVLDDVVAVAAEKIVVAEATVEVVVAGIAPDRIVVGRAGDEDVVASGAAKDDRLVTGIVQIVRVRSDSIGIVANDQLGDFRAGVVVSGPDDTIGSGDIDYLDASGRIGAAAGAAIPAASRPVNCLDGSTSKGEGGRLEDVAGKMCRVGVELHQLGEGIPLELGAEVQPGRAGQVVEAVGVLQVLELRLEDEVERRAKQAAERHLLFGETADPEIDGIDAGRGHAARRTGIDAGAVEEVEAVGWYRP